MAGVEQRKDYHHKDVFYHTLQVVDNISQKTNNVWLRFAALVHDIAKPKTKKFIEGIGWTFHAHEEVGARMMKKIFLRMKLPLTQLPYVEKLVRMHLRPIPLAKDEVTDSAIRRLAAEAGEDLVDLLTLCRADITSKNITKVSKFFKNYEIVEKKIVEVQEKDNLRNFQSPVKGEEIMEYFKISPSREVSVDSLLRDLQSKTSGEKIDSSALNTLEKLAEFYHQDDPIKTLEFSNKYLITARNYNDKKSIAHAYHYLGDYYRDEGLPVIAIDYYFSSMYLYEELNDPGALAYTNIDVGNVYFDLAKFDIALEDNNVNQLVMKKMLKNTGVEIDIADNGRIGFERALTNKYDLIFMDLLMPEMDGYEATKEIRNFNKEIPIIALTADVMKGVEDKTREAEKAKLLAESAEKFGALIEIIKLQMKTITVANFSFTPATTNAFVGDTIKFQWSNGSHTTTCDGTNGTTRPVGAASWNANMSSATPTFMYKITTAGNYHYVCLPHAPDMAGDIIATVSGINNISSLAEVFSLAQNYPNPFNPTTKINFSIPKSGYVTLKVYDILGNEVSNLVNENLSTGTYSVDFNAAVSGNALSSGVYFYRLNTSDFTEVKKMYLVK
ncbi:unnamed protein product [Rotaria sp. Silwood1]|nr:unnamed protein product [Rotaria sp. Silwood1]